MRRKLSSSVRVFFPKYTREEIIHRIRESLATLQKKVLLKRVVLFGSYAKGNHTVASDIDLLVVYKGSGKEDVYGLCKKIFVLPGLEPHVYAEGEYEVMQQTLERMVAGGVVLFSD
jgi:predicted nucleotidyltransferase